MSKGGQTTQTQTQTIDPQLMAKYNDIYSRGTQAVGATGNPYAAYTGEMTAPFSSQQNTASGAATSNLGNAQGLNTYGLLGSLMNANAGTVGGTDLGMYTNPYTKNVIDSTMNQMEQQRKVALQGIGDQAIAAGAYGGDRQGVAEGITNGQYGMNEAIMAAGLNQSNYQNAQNMAQQDVTNRFNQQGQNLSATNLGLGAQNTGVQNLYNIGLGAQNTQNQADASAYQKYLQGAMFPQNQVSYLSSLLSGTPKTGSTTTSTPYYTNPLSSIFGTALAGFTPLGGAGSSSLLGGLGGLLGI